MPAGGSVRAEPAGEISPVLDHSQYKEHEMAANPQQGKYLGEFIAGFTAFPAGLVIIASSGPVGVGAVVAIVGAGLLAHSAIGFYRIKNLEYSNEP
jgi:hypothetical protein